MPKPIPIEASTKVAALLDAYPELEEVLIGIAPPFKKLKNPLLRKSGAKVASLQQAAAVGRVSLPDMLNTLRSAVGQEPISSDDLQAEERYFTDQPDWFDESRIRVTFTENDLDEDRMPITILLKEGLKIEVGDIMELQTSFLPAPGIDALKNKGYLVWPRENSASSITTYFCKRGN